MKKTLSDKKIEADFNWFRLTWIQLILVLIDLFPIDSVPIHLDLIDLVPWCKIALKRMLSIIVLGTN